MISGGKAVRLWSAQEWEVLSANFIWEFFFFKERYREESNTCAFPTARNHGATILLSLLLVTLLIFLKLHILPFTF